MVLNKNVTDLIEMKQTFTVTNKEDLTAEVKKSMDQYQRSRDEQVREQRIQQEKLKENARYTADRERFVKDFIVGKKIVEPGRMGWCNQMKLYYKL